MTLDRMLISTLSIVLGITTARAADWPCYLGSNRTNHSAEKNLKLWSGDSPKIAWKANVGEGHSCMTVVGNRLYTQGNGTVWCLQRRYGQDGLALAGRWSRGR